MGTTTDDALQQHTVLATYRLRAGAEPAFRAILDQHGPTLARLGMIEGGVTVLRQEDEQGRITFVELFTWRPGAVGRAHEHPEVAAIWETMADHVEPHGDRPAMEFPHFARL